MPALLPVVKHLYQNHHLDSSRWNHYRVRDDDIVIATPYKSGTTWMQMIVMNLVFQDLQPRLVWDHSPWLDRCRAPIEEIIAMLEALEHRRFIKTHLPLDGLPYYPQVKYIVVGRDARDVFMSLWNHYRSFTDEVYENMAADPNRVGEVLPRPPEDIRVFWQQWITRGWFTWESEGYPFWSNMRHVQTWWDYRHLPNILFVHFSDLLDDLVGEIRRIAAFLQILIPDETVARIAEALTFKNVKQNAELLLPGMEEGFKGGSRTFINKGTNGRWRAVLTDEDLGLYVAAAERELSADCQQWLEQGTPENTS